MDDRKHTLMVSLISRQKLNNEQIVKLIYEDLWYVLIVYQNIKQQTISLIMDYIYKRAGDDWDKLYKNFMMLNNNCRKNMSAEQKQKVDGVLNGYRKYINR